MRKCTFIAFLLLLSIPKLIVAQSALSLLVSGNNTKCNGSSDGSAVVNISGGTSPYTYSWAPYGGSSDTANGLAAGKYTITVTDNNGIQGMDSIAINQPEPLTVGIDTIISNLCFINDSGGACGCNNTLWAVVNGGTPPFTYLWTPDSNTTDTISRVCYIEFGVTVSDANGCSRSNSIFISVPDPAGINELNNTSHIKIYPVPAKNQLTISSGLFNSGTYRLEIYDMTGRIVMSKLLNTNVTPFILDVSSLMNGDYLLRLSGTNSQETARFSIDR